MSEALDDCGVRSAGVGSGPPTDAAGHHLFGTFELARVLSHYDLGVVQRIKPYPRGSRKSPKVLLRTETGRYLLKRRADGKEDPYKVAFCHELQSTLAERHFPLPRLIGTRHRNNSMLQIDGATYELFEYIRGDPYLASEAAAADAGRVLALFHKLLADHESAYRPPEGSYHASRAVIHALERLPATLDTTFGVSADHADTARGIARRYRSSRDQVAALGFDQWPAQVIHGDWHPGNMLFQGSRVVAVIDYDAARIQQWVLDVANGLLQFSILGDTGSPIQWPEGLDLARYRRFLCNYASHRDKALTSAELQALPHLMIEALVAECVIPIAATGLFGRSDGRQFLTMVRRKAMWIERHVDMLTQNPLREA